MAARVPRTPVPPFQPLAVVALPLLLPWPCPYDRLGCDVPDHKPAHHHFPPPRRPTTTTYLPTCEAAGSNPLGNDFEMAMQGGVIDLSELVSKLGGGPGGGSGRGKGRVEKRKVKVKEVRRATPACLRVPAAAA